MMNPTDLPPPEIPGSPPAAKRRFKWWWFVAVLLAPPLLTALSVWLIDRKGDTAVGIAFCGSCLAGFISGTMLGCYIGKTVPTKVVLSIVFALILGVVFLTMSCFGCMASGYSLNLH